jgi:hypothetical protein
MWNDRIDERFVCRILDVQSGAVRVIPYPIYTVGPDGQTALALDFERLQLMRPGYGYAGLPDPYAADPAPHTGGIYRVDLGSGQATQILSIADIASFAFSRPEAAGAMHYVNHLLINPDGTRFVFLHRWRLPGGVGYEDVGGFGTRMLTATVDGNQLCVVDDCGYTSHFIWRDPRHILAWTRLDTKRDGFYLFQDQGDRVEQIGAGAMTRNGHCTYLPGGQWILNDTYPDEQQRQTVYLYHPHTDTVRILGRFAAPIGERGEYRADTHPRASRSGRFVTIDSAHGGDGRQIYLLELG